MHLFTNGQLDGGGVFIEALQQVSRLDMLVEECRLLPQHCLQVLLPQPGGLPGACKMEGSLRRQQTAFCLLFIDMPTCSTCRVTDFKSWALVKDPLVGTGAAAAWWPAPASTLDSDTK